MIDPSDEKTQEASAWMIMHSKISLRHDILSNGQVTRNIEATLRYDDSEQREVKALASAYDA